MGEAQDYRTTAKAEGCNFPKRLELSFLPVVQGFASLRFAVGGGDSLQKAEEAEELLPKKPQGTGVAKGFEQGVRLQDLLLHLPAAERGRREGRRAIALRKQREEKEKRAKRKRREGKGWGAAALRCRGPGAGDFAVRGPGHGQELPPIRRAKQSEAERSRAKQSERRAKFREQSYQRAALLRSSALLHSQRAKLSF